LSRRKARELALQTLFQIDLGQIDPDTALFYAFSREAEGDDSADLLGENERGFARDLVQGTWERKDALDQVIFQYAKDWTIERMAVVDRNILRLAIYEINHRDDVPDSAAIDEAVELAKTYSTAESGKFVNGILGSVMRGMKQGADGAEPTESRE
jgi:N utilization substance protein B